MGMGRDLWLKKSTPDRRRGTIRKFIHSMDGSSPAVRLMLIIERVLCSPQLSKESWDAPWLSSGSEAGRENMIHAARSMSSISLWHGDDLIECWADDCNKGPARAQSINLFSKARNANHARMISMLSFAVDNMQWADRLADTLMSFIVKASRHDGCTDGNGNVIPWDREQPLGVRSGRIIPLRCISAIACMVRAAFGDSYSENPVSPLSVTLSMIVGRHLDAGSALNLPMVADGLYGDGRDPMGDLQTILDYAGEHGDDKGIGSMRPKTLSLFAYVPDHADSLIDSLYCMDDAAMFLIMTDPVFPDHVGEAMMHARTVLSPLRSSFTVGEHAKRPIRIPLLAADMLKAVEMKAPPGVVRLLGRTDNVHQRLQCDGDLEWMPTGIAFPDTMLSAGREAVSQRRGMMLAEGIISTDWSRCDTEGMMDIIAKASTPRYDATGDPMSMLIGEQGIMPLDSGSVGNFIIACLDSGNHRLAADMNMLADLMMTVDEMIGSEERAEALWVCGEASALRGILDEISEGIPMESACQSIPMMFSIHGGAHYEPEGRYSLFRADLGEVGHIRNWGLYLDWRG